jgi:hypothetical protein
VTSSRLRDLQPDAMTRPCLAHSPMRQCFALQSKATRTIRFVFLTGASLSRSFPLHYHLAMSFTGTYPRANTVGSREPQYRTDAPALAHLANAFHGGFAALCGAAGRCDPRAHLVRGNRRLNRGTMLLCGDHVSTGGDGAFGSRKHKARRKAGRGIL